VRAWRALARPRGARCRWAAVHRITLHKQARRYVRCGIWRWHAGDRPTAGLPTTASTSLAARPCAPGGGRSTNHSAPTGCTPARRRSAKGSQKPPKPPVWEDTSSAPAAAKEPAGHGPAAAGCRARATARATPTAAARATPTAGQAAGAEALTADAPEDAAGGSLARDRRRCE
jgi:hypothetical protein